MERFPEDRKLLGRIMKLFYRVPGKARFRVMIDDDQLVTEPILFIKPRSLIIAENEEGLLAVTSQYGLVTLPHEVIRPGHFIPVIQPARPDRRPYIPLRELITRGV